MTNSAAQPIRRWALIAAVAVAAALAIYPFAFGSVRRTRIVFSAGDAEGHRHDLAELLRDEALSHRLRIELKPTAGSVAALEALAAGELDAAMVQGGLASRPGVRQVAVLQNEPLHVLVRADRPVQGLSDLKGLRLNLSTAESGSRRLATEVLEYAGLTSNDFEDLAFSYRELIAMGDAELPDAVFFVSTLPSTVATSLVQRGVYRMLDVPFSEALEQRTPGLARTTIPEYYYSARPPEAVPLRDVETIAAPLAVVVRETLPDVAVLRLLESIFDGDFAYHARIGPIDARAVLERHDHPLHAAVRRYHRRDEPLVRGDWIESLENARSFMFSALVAGFVAWRWYSRRQAVRFEKYIDAVGAIEREALATPLGRGDDIAALERRLCETKAEALDLYSAGKLGGDEHFTAFLTHVADVRRVLLAARAENDARKTPAALRQEL